MKNQTIGIEIEMTGITRATAAETVANYLGGTTRRVYGTYDTYEVKAPDGRIWKLMSDSSIFTKKKVNGELVTADKTYSVELVSPILTYADIDTLQELVRQLRRAGGISDAAVSTAVHIHLGANNHTPQTLRNLINLMASKEDLIYKSLQVDPTRVRYCAKVNEKLLATINQRKPKTLQALADIWYDGYTGNREAHYHQSRYHGINLHSLFTKGTCEFRLFNGTLHAGKIRAYIIFCLAVNHQALTQKSASAKRTATDNEKYTFRCWLLRLGLIGEEFKNCREHLMANLTGDSAFRNSERRIAA